MEHEIPKKLGVLATHGDGEPPKTLDARYVKEIMYYIDNPEKTTFNYVMEDTLDQRGYFKGLLLDTKRETIMGSNLYVVLVCSGSMLET